MQTTGFRRCPFFPAWSQAMCLGPQEPVGQQVTLENQDLPHVLSVMSEKLECVSQSSVSDKVPFHLRTISTGENSRFRGVILGLISKDGMKAEYWRHIAPGCDYPDHHNRVTSFAVYLLPSHYPGPPEPQQCAKKGPKAPHTHTYSHFHYRHWLLWMSWYPHHKTLRK